MEFSSPWLFIREEGNLFESGWIIIWWDGRRGLWWLEVLQVCILPLRPFCNYYSSFRSFSFYPSSLPPFFLYTIPPPPPQKHNNKKKTARSRSGNAHHHRSHVILDGHHLSNRTRMEEAQIIIYSRTYNANCIEERETKRKPEKKQTNKWTNGNHDRDTN
mgnify:CR=1 FL=1